MSVKGGNMGKPLKKIKEWRSLECHFTTEIYYRHRYCTYNLLMLWWHFEPPDFLLDEIVLCLWDGAPSGRSHAVPMSVINIIPSFSLFGRGAKPRSYHDQFKIWLTDIEWTCSQSPLSLKPLLLSSSSSSHLSRGGFGRAEVVPRRRRRHRIKSLFRNLPFSLACAVSLVNTRERVRRRADLHSRVELQEWNCNRWNKRKSQKGFGVRGGGLRTHARTHASTHASTHFPMQVFA